nr:unnamed protein product [Callosobruchus chinensis]
MYLGRTGIWSVQAYQQVAVFY